MTSGSDFLASLAKQCADLRINIAEEYESSIAMLHSRLQSLSAENDELRMQLKRLPSSTDIVEERSQKSSDDIRGGEEGAVLLLGKEIEMPVPTRTMKRRSTSPPIMKTSAAGNSKVHIEDVEGFEKNPGAASAKASSSRVRMVETAGESIIPGCVTSARGKVGFVGSPPAPGPSNAKSPGGQPVRVAFTSEQAEGSEHEQENMIAPQALNVRSVPAQPTTKKKANITCRFASLDSSSWCAEDENNGKASDSSASKKSQSSRPKENMQGVSEDSENDQEDEKYESAPVRSASGHKVGCEAAGRGCTFVESEDGPHEDDVNENAAQDSHSQEDDSSNGIEASDNSSEDGELYDLADVWAEQDTDIVVGGRSSRAVLGSVTSQPPNEVPTKFSIDIDFTQERAKLSNASILSFIQYHCILHPFSKQHVAWEMMGFNLLIYDITLIPLSIFEPEETDFTIFMTWAVRTFWTADIAVSCLTGYIDKEGITVMTLKKVVWNYTKTQLPLDSIVVLFDWLDAFIGLRGTGIMKGGRILRLVRLVRMRKARQLWEKLSEYVNADKAMVLLKASKNLMILLILLHFVACTWWGIGLLDVNSGRSWIARGGYLHLSVGEKYLASALMGLSNFYGAHFYIPETVPESFYALVLLYLSFICQMWMVSSITTAMTHLEIVSSRRTHMFAALDKFMTTHQISRELRMRVNRSARHALQEKEQNTIEADIELLQLISQPMMIRLHVQMFAPVIKAAPFLRCLMLADGATGRQLCHTAITVDQCHKDDVIFSIQEKPVRGMVRFVPSGEVRYVAGNKLVGKKILCCADWLSEMVLWTDDWVHRGTARASSDCQMVCLNAEKFRQLVGFQATGATARVYAKLRLNQINGEPESVSDLGVCDADMSRILGIVFPEIWQTVSHEYWYGCMETNTTAAKIRSSAALLGRYSVTVLPR